jgi:two-component system, OmpR family, response regulator
LPHRALKRILVVDDDPDLLALVSLALTALGGFTVETCGSAADAVDVARVFGPDLVLLDVMMPGHDGFAVLSTMRQLPSTSGTPVVLMSAHRLQRQEFARCEELGCLGVIPKPFDPGTLPERLEELWGLSARRRLEAHRSEFEALRRTYMAELMQKVAAMEKAAAIVARSGWDLGAVEALYHLAHRMAGSAGLYRLASLSRSSGALEEIVHRMITGPWPPAGSPAQLARLVRAVARAARSESETDSASLTAAPPAPALRSRIQRA